MSNGKRELVFDLTHVVSRLAIRTPTGIDRVDLMFAEHLVGGTPPIAAAVHYGFMRPHGLDAGLARTIVATARELWHPEGSETEIAAAEIFSGVVKNRPRNVVKLRNPTPAIAWKMSRLAEIQRLRTRRIRNYRVPQNAVYINTAQHFFEFPLFFNWLGQRSDLVKVFFLHDLIPLDYPEFFPAGYLGRFERRMRTIARHATALIVSSASVGARAQAEMRRRGRPDIPIHTAPLPSTIAHDVSAPKTATDPAPYFLTVGTLEPRKNHLLLLHIWRELAKRGGAIPRLVLVGQRGWENEQAMDILSRSFQVRPHVSWLSGLSGPQMERLIAGARALLMPSFAEGYGLPLVEALSLGTPVVASDIPVFREVSQERALFLSPLDGAGWLAAIEKMTDADSPLRGELLSKAAAFRAPSPADYFKKLQEFLASQ